MRNVLKLLNTKQFKEALNLAEQEIFLATLAHTKNNQTKAARLLGVARGTLRSRIKEWDTLHT